MNILMETMVLLNWVSDKTKQEEGQCVFERIREILPEAIDIVSDKQIELFVHIVPLFSRAEIICLKAYLKERMEHYTIDGPCSAYEEQTVDHWHGVYSAYFDALT